MKPYSALMLFVLALGFHQVVKASEISIPLDLEAAKQIELSMINWPTFFRIRMTPERLNNVACIYEIDRSSSTFEKIAALIDESASYENVGPGEIDFRIGVKFKYANGTELTFYFDDWNGSHELNGVLNGKRIKGKAYIPIMLRAFLRDARLVPAVKPNSMECAQ